MQTTTVIDILGREGKIETLSEIRHSKRNNPYTAIKSLINVRKNEQSEVVVVKHSKTMMFCMFSLAISALLTGFFVAIFLFDSVHAISKPASFVGIVGGLWACYTAWKESEKKIC